MSEAIQAVLETRAKTKAQAKRAEFVEVEVQEAPIVSWRES